MVDKDELASFVARRLLDCIENCDLPRPNNTRVEEDVNIIACCFGGDEISSYNHHSSTHPRAPAHSCQKLSIWDKGQWMSDADKLLRDIQTHELPLELHSLDNNATKAHLMVALCHSQTRARKAEKAARQTLMDKDRMVNLVSRQASHLFAYKQWICLLQLDNIYLQLMNSKGQESISIVFPNMLPQTTWETQKSRHKSISRKRAKGSSRGCTCKKMKYALVFALGLGLAGAGFSVGWSMGSILPVW